ncbi:MAG: hypothetical protein Q8O87_04175 [bacterium]|nr:hypothetical protein [bacterium]
MSTGFTNTIKATTPLEITASTPLDVTASTPLEVTTAGTTSLNITAGTNTPSTDAFGRWRTSDPVTIFDSTMQYDATPLFWETVLVGGASVAHLPNESSLNLTCGTANNDSVIRQTYEYFRYQPGKSQLIVMTAVFGIGKANNTKRIGYFDASNGAFFE